MLLQQEVLLLERCVVYQVWASFSQECFQEHRVRLKGLPWLKNRTEMRFSVFLV